MHPALCVRTASVPVPVPCPCLCLCPCPSVTCAGASFDCYGESVRSSQNPCCSWSIPRNFSTPATPTCLPMSPGTPPVPSLSLLREPLLNVSPRAFSLADLYGRLIQSPGMHLCNPHSTLLTGAPWWGTRIGVGCGRALRQPPLFSAEVPSRPRHFALSS